MVFHKNSGVVRTASKMLLFICITLIRGSNISNSLVIIIFSDGGLCFVFFY